MDTRIVCFDLETDGLYDEATKVWCIATRDMNSREEKLFGPGEILDGLAYLAEADIIVGHNAIGFDYPVLEKLYGWSHPAGEDSLVLSRLYNPDRHMGHSIDAWGQKLGIAKPVHEDWSQYSEEMGHRCIEDTRILTRVVRQLLDEAKGHDWREPIGLAYDMARLQHRIEKRGVLLDVAEAVTLEGDLADFIDESETELLERLPIKANPLTPTDKSEGGGVKKPFLKSGNLSKSAEEWIGEGSEEMVGGPFSRVDWKKISLTSSKQVKEWLVSLGWVADDWNYVKAAGGQGYEKNPDGSYKISSSKVTQSSLEALDDPVGVLYRDWSVAKHRKTMVRHVTNQGKQTGWLNVMRDDNTVPAVAIPSGAATHRFIHRNIVNVPGTEAPWGERLRSCLVARDGYEFAGTDAKGFQNRIAGSLAWQYDGGKYFEEVLGEGDIHLKNRVAFERILGRMLVEGNTKASRSVAKAVAYAVMFGAAGGKIASMLSCSLDLAKKVIDKFWDNCYGLGPYREKIIEEARFRGTVPGLDGRIIPVRSPHSALNLKIQSDEAICMVKAFVMLDEVGRERDWNIVAHFHDEMLVEIPTRPGEREIYLEAVKGIGKAITGWADYKVPVEFSTEFGRNYAEVH